MDTPAEAPEPFGPAKRHEKITGIILRQGSVLVEELAEILNVSRMTIHRDLDDLEQQGVLRKIRNGATAQPSSLFESDVRYRLNLATQEKEALARLALTYIEPGQAIIMDDTTTLIPLARLLYTLAPLTVITNFLPIIKELTESKGIRLISLGGEYLPRFDTFTGLICEQAVASLRANALFTSTTAVSEGTAFHPEQQIVNVKRAMMAAATRRYLLLDHTKFGKIALHRLASLQDFDLVIVDSKLGEARINELREAGVQVEVTPV